MQLLTETGGHIHDPSFHANDDTMSRCRHCGRHIKVNAANSAWVPVQFEASDFVRRPEGDYIIPNPDREGSWLACVWNMSGKGHSPAWRHDRMMLSAPSFRTMRDCIAD